MSSDLSEILQRQFYFFGTYFLEEDPQMLGDRGEGSQTYP